MVRSKCVQSNPATRFAYSYVSLLAAWASRCAGTGTVGTSLLVSVLRRGYFLLLQRLSRRLSVWLNVRSHEASALDIPIVGPYRGHPCPLTSHRIHSLSCHFISGPPTACNSPPPQTRPSTTQGRKAMLSRLSRSVLRICRTDSPSSKVQQLVRRLSTSLGFRPLRHASVGAYR
jgi:hypothetical protein